MGLLITDENFITSKNNFVHYIVSYVLGWQLPSKKNEMLRWLMETFLISKQKFNWKNKLNYIRNSERLKIYNICEYRRNKSKNITIKYFTFWKQNKWTELYAHNLHPAQFEKDANYNMQNSLYVRLREMFESVFTLRTRCCFPVLYLLPALL
jgi:hypothetical protein